MIKHVTNTSIYLNLEIFLNIVWTKHSKSKGMKRKEKKSLSNIDMLALFKQEIRRSEPSLSSLVPLYHACFLCYLQAGGFLVSRSLGSAHVVGAPSRVLPPTSTLAETEFIPGISLSSLPDQRESIKRKTKGNQKSENETSHRWKTQWPFIRGSIITLQMKTWTLKFSVINYLMILYKTIYSSLTSKNWNAKHNTNLKKIKFNTFSCRKAREMMLHRLKTM